MEALSTTLDAERVLQCHSLSSNCLTRSPTLPELSWSFPGIRELGRALGRLFSETQGGCLPALLLYVFIVFCFAFCSRPQMSWRTGFWRRWKLPFMTPLLKNLLQQFSLL